MRDPLTGLYNRRYVEETMPRELARAARQKAPLSVVVLDVDHFKRFNDTNGHAAGDVVLRQVGAVLRSTFRAADVVSRYGGEEFVAVLPDCGLADATARANAVCSAIRDLSVSHEGKVLAPITVSAGVAAYPLHGTDPDALFQHADRALYRAKADGRDRVTTAPAAPAVAAA
jgi:diguanylate cyclase (GGDEF)-like protein